MGTMVRMALCLALAGLPAHAEDSLQPANGMWDYLRQQYYGARDIGIADDRFMSLEVPQTTPDPAATPLSLRLGVASRGALKQLRLIVDNNPSPLVATLDVAPGAQLDGLETRVRVDRYTSVRVVAETGDGRLLMRSAWVNAAGGCSTPPAASGGGNIGDIRFRPSPDGRALLVSVRHPNYSGFQIDPRSGDAIPAHYVSSLLFKSGERPLLSAELGISISENPSLRISSAQPLPAPITVEAVDTRHAHFSAVWSGVAASAGGLH